MTHRLPLRCSLVFMLSLTLPSCGTADSSPTARSSGLAQWSPALGVHGVVDVSTQRRDGAVTVAAGGRLALLRGRVLVTFARGPQGYAASPGDEPYIALSSGRRLPRLGCSFGEDVIYALKLGARAGVVAVDARGRASRFVDLPSGGVLTGITFDTTGRFGGRLLVIANSARAMSVFAIDCPTARRAAHKLRAQGRGRHRGRAEELRCLRR